MDNTRSKLLAGIEIRPALVLLDLEADNNKQVLEQLSSALLAEGMVKPSFESAIIKREEEFCTGLAFEEMSIAIPHTDSVHVLKPSMAIGVLKEPVTFQSMGEPEVPTEAEMVFMLGITDPNTQLDFLQSLMQIFQESGKLRGLKKCKTPEELIALFQSYF